jgi:hypothetical protein
MSHPYTDPWHSGMTVTPGQILTGRDMYRRPPAASGANFGAAGGAAGPDVVGAVGDVLHGAGYSSPAEPSEDSGETEEPKLIKSDADLPKHGVFSGGDGNLYHVRPMAGASSGGNAGSYAVTHVGTPGDGAV